MGIAWHLLEVRKTEEKQTPRLSRVVPLKGGLLMSVAFFRPPNHRVPEGSVDVHPIFPSPVEVFRGISAPLSDSNNFRARRNHSSSLLPLRQKTGMNLFANLSFYLLCLINLEYIIIISSNLTLLIIMLLFLGNLQVLYS